MSDREIYEEIRGPLTRFAASLVGPDDAADLVSETVVAVLQRRPLASLDNPQAYLMRSVLNRTRSRARSAARERRAVARLGAPGSSPAADDGLSDVTRTVSTLPPQQRAAIYLVHWEGMSPTEAAHQLGVRPATVRRYLHLAHNRLRRYLT